MKYPALEIIRKEMGSLDVLLEAALEAAYTAGVATHGPHCQNTTLVKWRIGIDLFFVRRWFIVVATEQALQDCYAPLAFACGCAIRCYEFTELFEPEKLWETTPDFEFEFSANSKEAKK